MSGEEFQRQLIEAQERKRIFKEYIAQHTVLEIMNEAMGALFKQDPLPQQPLQFIAEYISCRQIVPQERSNNQ